MMAERFEVRPMRRDELTVLHRLSDLEGWNIPLSEFQVGFDVYPVGWNVAVDINGEIVGFCVGMTLNDDLGMMANFIVEKKYRRLGIGRKLWKACKRGLEGKNILLNAINIDLYTQDGFHPDQEIAMWTYKITSPISLQTTADPECSFHICDMKDISFSNISKYDKKLGPSYDRSVLFENYIIKSGTASAVAIDKISGEVLGYGILKMGTEAWKANPIYAETDDVSRKLLERLLLFVPEGDTVSLLPFAENTSAISILKEIGFTKSWFVTSMYTQYKIPVPTEKIFSASGLQHSIF